MVRATAYPNHYTPEKQIYQTPLSSAARGDNNIHLGATSISAISKGRPSVGHNPDGQISVLAIPPKAELTAFLPITQFLQNPT